MFLCSRLGKNTFKYEQDSFMQVRDLKDEPGSLVLAKNDQVQR